jgi:hypothetical protein
MLTEGWTNFLLLCSLFYIVYLQYQLSERDETIESFNELVMEMAEELTELGSPNVTWKKINEEG